LPHACQRRRARKAESDSDDSHLASDSEDEDDRVPSMSASFNGLPGPLTSSASPPYPRNQHGRMVRMQPAKRLDFGDIRSPTNNGKAKANRRHDSQSELDSQSESELDRDSDAFESASEGSNESEQLLTPKGDKTTCHTAGGGRRSERQFQHKVAAHQNGRTKERVPHSLQHSSEESADDVDYIIAGNYDSDVDDSSSDDGHYREDFDDYSDNDDDLAPSQNSAAEATITGEELKEAMGLVDEFANGEDFQPLPHTASNPGCDAEDVFESHPPGLSSGWFENGDPTEEQIWDPLWVFFFFMPVSFFKSIAARTDAKAARARESFEREEIQKQSEAHGAGKQHRRQKMRDWEPTGMAWGVTVQWLGVHVWRSSTKRHRSDHVDAWSQSDVASPGNAGNYDEHIANTMGLKRHEQIKRFFCVCDQAEVNGKSDPAVDGHDPIAKVRSIMEMVRKNAERLFCPTCNVALDESTFGCHTCGPGCLFRQIKGKNVASNGWQFWMLACTFATRAWATAAHCLSGTLTALAATIPHTWIPRMRDHHTHKRGGSPVLDRNLGQIGNSVVTLMARLRAACPARKWGHVYVDELHLQWGEGDSRPSEG